MGRLDYRTLRENVVDIIRDKIIKHELQPGSRIIEQDISDELGVSRGPIREAFRQLEQEGLVEYTRNVGCSVKEITYADLFEVYTMRCAYEILAVKSFKGSIPQSALDQMQVALEHMKHVDVSDFKDSIECDNEFHLAIVEATGMKRLTQAWKDLEFASYISCYMETFDPKTLADRQYPFHKQMYDFYESGDTDAVCADISRHYLSALTRKMQDQGVSSDSFNFSSNMLSALL